MSIKKRADTYDLSLRRGDQLLPRSGTCRHHKHAVQGGQIGQQHLGGCFGLDGEHRACPATVDFIQYFPDVLGCLKVKADQISRLHAVVVKTLAWGVSHQMDVQRDRGGGAQLLDKVGSKCQIGHEAAVHHVDM